MKIKIPVDKSVAYFILVKETLLEVDATTFYKYPGITIENHLQELVLYIGEKFIDAVAIYDNLDYFLILAEDRYELISQLTKYG